MHERKRIIYLFIIMVLLTLSVGGTAIFVLYDAAFQQQRERLAETVKSQARLMEAIARFDQVYSQSDHPEGASAATLSQIIDAQTKFKGFGETGEFTLGKREGQIIFFLLDHRHFDLNNSHQVPFDSKLAEPMRRALLGQAGTIVDLDYRGIVVLAAYEPVDILNFGIVAKIDLSEIRKPFVNAGFVVIFFAVLLILIGTFLFFRVSSPFLEILERTKEDLERLVEQRTQDLEQSNQELNLEIVKREQAYEAIRKYEKIFDASTEHISLVDKNYTYQAVNKSYLRAHNKKREEIVGKSISEMLGSEIFETRVKEKVDNCLKGNKVNYQDWFEFSGLGRCYMDVNYYPYYDVKGEITGLVVDARDITEREKIGQQLRESELRFRKAILNAPYQIMIHAEGEVLQLSDTWTQLTGYTIEDIPNIYEWTKRAYGRHNLDSKAREIIDKIYEIKENEKTEVGEWPVVTKSGETLLWELSVASLGTLSDGRRAVITMAKDITEQKKLEKKIRQTQKIEALGTLAGGIAHDFNNILGTIQGFTELLQEEISENSDAERYLETIHKSTTRAVELVKQILTYSRTSEEKLHPINISLTVEEAIGMIRATTTTNIEIQKNIDLECPAIMGNSTQIHQVIINLCTNAVHAMEETGGTLEVGLQKTKPVNKRLYKDFFKNNKEGCVHLFVKDTGIGILPKDIERIFDPFYTTKEVGKGTGLGLSAIHGIIENHKGLIIFESEPGKGTTVNIYFPIVDISPIENKEDTSPKKGTEHILIVDDEKYLVMFYEIALKQLGYKISAFTDSQKALDAFQDQPDQFDMVLTDLNMPKLTGTQLSQEILKIRKDIPIILATGHSDAIFEKEAKLLGIRHFITKPVTLVALTEVVRKIAH